MAGDGGGVKGRDDKSEEYGLGEERKRKEVPKYNKICFLLGGVLVVAGSHLDDGDGHVRRAFRRLLVSPRSVTRSLRISGLSSGTNKREEQVSWGVRRGRGEQGEAG